MEAPTISADEIRAASEIAASVEAVLFTADRAVSASKIAEAVGIESDAGATVSAAVDALNNVYDESGRAFRIEKVAGGYRVMTLPEHAGVVAAYRGERAKTRLSKAALETLAIIAYKQPITRAQLEAIRGVGCGEILRSLLERRLVTITGRAEELGRPMLYGTTRGFLDAFGLSSIGDLPKSGELGSPA